MTPDDFTVGMMVTVLEWEKKERVDHDWLTGTVVVSTNNDTSWVGDVLRIEAINLPFIVCRQIYTGGRGESRPFKLDTRRAKVRRLSDDYVRAMLCSEERT